MRPVRNLLPDHVDQSTMGVDPREPSGPTPGSSAPTRRGKRRWASTGWMTWIARRFGGAWTAQAPGDSNPPDTPVCLLCQKYVTEAHLMSEPHEANMQGFTHVISKEGLRVTQNPVNWATWEEALAEPEQLELGVKARSVVALGPSPKKTTAAAPAIPVVVEIDESDEDWGEWRPTTEIPAPTTPPHPKDPPISMMQPPGEPVSPTAVYTEHRRGPSPGMRRAWRDSLSNLGYHGPHLQLHLSTPGHTAEGLQAVEPLSFLRMQAKDHAQLPVSLIPPKATSDLSMETGEAGTWIPAGRPFNNNEPSHSAQGGSPHWPTIRGPAPSKVAGHTGCEVGRAEAGASDTSASSSSAAGTHARNSNSVEWRAVGCIYETCQASPRSPRARSFSLPVSLVPRREKRARNATATTAV